LGAKIPFSGHWLGGKSAAGGAKIINRSKKIRNCDGFKKTVITFIPYLPVTS